MVTNLFYAWNMMTDEIKIFRFEHARDNFVKENEKSSDWVHIEEKDLSQ